MPPGPARGPGERRRGELPAGPQARRAARRSASSERVPRLPAEHGPGPRGVHDRHRQGHVEPPRLGRLQAQRVAWPRRARGPGPPAASPAARRAPRPSSAGADHRIGGDVERPARPRRVAASANARPTSSECTAWKRRPVEVRDDRDEAGPHERAAAANGPRNSRRISVAASRLKIRPGPQPHDPQLRLLALQAIELALDRRLVAGVERARRSHRSATTRRPRGPSVPASTRRPRRSRRAPARRPRRRRRTPARCRATLTAWVIDSSRPGWISQASRMTASAPAQHRERGRRGRCRRRRSARRRAASPARAGRPRRPRGRRVARPAPRARSCRRSRSRRGRRSSCAPAAGSATGRGRQPGAGRTGRAAADDEHLLLVALAEQALGRAASRRGARSSGPSGPRWRSTTSTVKPLGLERPDGRAPRRRPPSGRAGSTPPGRRWAPAPAQIRSSSTRPSSPPSHARARPRVRDLAVRGRDVRRIGGDEVEAAAGHRREQVAAARVDPHAVQRSVEPGGEHRAAGDVDRGHAAAAGPRGGDGDDPAAGAEIERAALRRAAARGRARRRASSCRSEAGTLLAMEGVAPDTGDPRAADRRQTTLPGADELRARFDAGAAVHASASRRR